MTLTHATPMRRMADYGCRRGLNWVEVQWPTRIVSLANARMHWRDMHSHTERIKGEVQRLVLPKLDLQAIRRSGECTVLWTRIGPGTLDSDNLHHAFKYHRDAVAKAVGVDDGNESSDLVPGFWTWRYRQERGAYGVVVRVEFGAAR